MSKTVWWRGAVIYQIYPRSFMDLNGDGVGDLPGITEKLPYIASLGVDGIWISPFFTSPMKDFGYDVADYRDVDPLFGTLQDFDDLLNRAHALDLKVIIDQVYSHTSDQHPWFAESRQSRDNPKADWYVWADPKPDGSPPNNWQSVFTIPAWTWDARREQYFLHNFLAEQPDLNLHHPDVQDALLDVARFWLDRGVDGFRLDAINCGMHDPELRDNPPSRPPYRNTTRPSFMQTPVYNMCHDDMPRVLERVRKLTDEYGDIFTVAEVGAPEPLPIMKTYTQGAKRLNSAYGFEFLSAEELTPELVRNVIEDWPGAGDEGWPSWAFSNHDAPRVVSRWLADAEPDRRAKLFAMILLTLRGNAFIYNGEELGLPQADVPFEQLQDPEAFTNWPHTLGRDGARTPMPWTDAAHGGFSTVPTWLPVPGQHLRLSVAGQEARDESALQFVRRLIGLRRASTALRSGEQVFLDAPPGVLAYSRTLGTERWMAVFNLTPDPVDWMPDGAESLTGVVALDGVGATVAAFSGYVGHLSA